MADRRFRRPIPRTARHRLASFRQRYLMERSHRPINDVDPVRINDPRLPFLQELSMRMLDRIAETCAAERYPDESA